MAPFSSATPVSCRQPTLVWLALALSLLSACDSFSVPRGPRKKLVPRDSSQPEGAARRVVPLTAPEVAPQPWPRERPRPGPAFFATNGRGLLELGQHGLKVRNSRPETVARVVGLDEDSLVLLSNHRVLRLTGETLQDLTPTDSPPIDQLQMGPGGTLWMETPTTLASLASGRWTDIPKTDLDASNGTFVVKGLRVDGADAPWLLTSTCLWTLGPQGWVRLEPPFDGSAPPLVDLVLFEGLAAILSPGAVVDYDGLEWGLTAVTPPDIKGRMLLMDSDGRRWLNTRSQWHLSTPEKPVFRTVADPDLPFEGTIRVATVDASGRLWFATETGVYVVSAEQKANRIGHTDEQDLGASITDILVLGKGPTLPPAVPLGSGAIHGRVEARGFPLAGVAVHMCSHPDPQAGRSPCLQSPFMRTAVTGDDGSFTVEDVPIGHYRFAVRAQGQWFLSKASAGSRMREGQVYELGTLLVTSEEVFILKR